MAPLNLEDAGLDPKPFYFKPGGLRQPVHKSEAGASRPFQGYRIISLLLVSVLFLYSCASSGNELSPGAGRDSSRIIRNVPFYAQQEHQCGPTALAEVLNFYGANTSPGRIASEIYSKSARGTLDLDMSFYAGKAGFSASQYFGGAEDIKEKIDHGLPLIVFVDYGIWVYQRGHFMTITGYDADGVIAHTGQTPFKHISWAEFLGPWKKTGCWTLLITPKGKEITSPETARDEGK